jgi:hypothetical protein
MGGRFTKFFFQVLVEISMKSFILFCIVGPSGHFLMQTGLAVGFLSVDECEGLKRIQNDNGQL